MTYADVGRHAEAVDHLERSVAASGGEGSHVRKAFALLCSATPGGDGARRGRRARGAGGVPAGRGAPVPAGALLWGGACWRRPCGLPRRDGEAGGAHFTSVNEGVAGHLARHNLAAVLLEMGDHAGPRPSCGRSPATGRLRPSC